MNQPRLSYDVLLFSGVLSLIGAALAGEMAWLHMRALNDMCGELQSHCIWCPTGTGLAAIGTALLATRVVVGRKQRPLNPG